MTQYQYRTNTAPPRFRLNWYALTVIVKFDNITMIRRRMKGSTMRNKKDELTDEILATAKPLREVDPNLIETMIATRTDPTLTRVDPRRVSRPADKPYPTEPTEEQIRQWMIEDGEDPDAEPGPGMTWAEALAHAKECGHVNVTPEDIFQYASFGNETNERMKRSKATLGAEIINAADATGLSSSEIAKQIGFAAADISRIRHLQLGRFTIDRLMRILHALDPNNQTEVRRVA
jgi:predicted XRE-type DNA-binding protein